MMLALVLAMVLLAAAPALAQESGANDEVTVQSGDTLSGIAGEVFGDPERWTVLYEANQNRIGDSADLIYPGQVLRVPEVGREAERVQREVVQPAPTQTGSGSSASPTASTAASEEQIEAAQREAEEPVQAEAELGSSASASASATASASASAAPEEEVREEAATEQASAAASASASASAAPSEDAPADAPAAVPSDTTMYLTVPKMGISDVPVVEGTTEASLSAGAGHLSTTGYPWVPGSNTYIAGHRLGYPGTPSDHVFYDLPSLVAGDEVILTDSNGTTYTYAVSNIVEVSPTDLSVTAPVGRDVVSLQTCTENFGDYWTAGPNWLARYVVQADKVS